MKLKLTERGFEIVEATPYPDGGKDARLVQQSSAIGDQEGSFDHPGSSFLWIGKDHHLNREEVAELRSRLDAWLDCGSLQIPGDES